MHIWERVEEMQGLNGPFGLSEFVVQGIWSRGDFMRSGLRTDDGRRLTIATPGRWNHGAGPDFSEAIIYLDGVRHAGEVEVHVHAGDWALHRHASDPEYSGVVLHVVVFGQPEAPTVGWGGCRVPTLVLLPHLWQDLERHAEDHALISTLPASGDTASRWPIEWVTSAASRRWEAKVLRCRARVEGWGWTQAVHATTLEVLGFATNRRPMLTLAAEFPWETWTPAPGEDAVRARYFSTGQWVTTALRPANHPLRRLTQYADWVGKCRDWPERLRAIKLPVADTETIPAAAWRRAVGWSAWEMNVRESLGASGIGVARWRTWLADAALPLLGVLGRPGAAEVWRAMPPSELGSKAAGLDGSDSNEMAQGVWALERSAGG